MTNSRGLQPSPPPPPPSYAYRRMARKLTNLTPLEAFAKEEWANIPQETCRKLVDTSYKNRLEAVIKKAILLLKKDIGLSKPMV